ncbi:Hypothetical protein NTJ_02062 [Nesidiocoris tenuis]|nr:Hypothetical protein NTJ_02062 [Nesidiocoris tenuis]
MNELDEFGMMGADVIYEDLMARTLMDRRKRRKKTSSASSSRGYHSNGFGGGPGSPNVWEQNFGMNTLGHLRIDYSGNWNKLDSIIGHAC